MKVKLAALALAGGLAGGILSSMVVHARGQVGVIVPPPEQLRFRLVSDEPIATGDARSIVAGYTVMVFRDTARGQCYIAFVSGAAISATGPSACP